MQIRIQKAVEMAQQAFWASIATAFPEIKTGDFPMDAEMAFDEACTSAVTTWVEGNTQDLQPEQQDSSDDLTSELLQLGFSLESTGGGCEAWYLASGQYYVYITDTDGSTARGLKTSQTIWLGYYQSQGSEHLLLSEGCWEELKPAVLAFKSGEWAKARS